MQHSFADCPKCNKVTLQKREMYLFPRHWKCTECDAFIEHYPYILKYCSVCQKKTSGIRSTILVREDRGDEKTNIWYSVLPLVKRCTVCKTKTN